MANFAQLSNKPDLTTVLKSSQEEISTKINCMKIAIVEEFNATTKIAKVRIANKVVTGLNKDGTQQLADYPPIFAKVYYMGWGSTGITFPLVKGMEGFLLFNDREIESWYINGDINQLAYDRKHSLSDAIFVCGVQSKPNLVAMASNCLNLYYGNTNIALASDSIAINGDTTQTGTFTSNKLISLDGASGSFVSKDDKTITVRNGIITGIS